MLQSSLPLRLSLMKDPSLFFAALGNPFRWQIVQMLAGGEALSSTEVARRVGREFDGVNKHLRVLCDAGVVACKPGEDRRFGLCYIADSVRAKPGVLDYGFCTIQLPQPTGQPADLPRN